MKISSKIINNGIVNSNISIVFDKSKLNILSSFYKKEPGKYAGLSIYKYSRKKETLEHVTTIIGNKLIAVNKEQYKNWKNSNLLGFPTEIYIN